MAAKEEETLMSLTTHTIGNARYNVQCKARETLTVVGVVQTLTAGMIRHATYDPARYAEVTTEAASVRFTRDGTTPDPSTHIGMVLTTSQVLPLFWNDLEDFQVIVNTTGETAYVQVDYFYDV